MDRLSARNPYPLGAEKAHGPQVRAFQSVLPHHRALHFVQRVFVIGHVHAQDVRRAEQAVGVFLQAEDGGASVGLVGAYAFENAHTVVQGVRQHVHLGFPVVPMAGEVTTCADVREFSRPARPDDRPMTADTTSKRQLTAD